MKFYKFFFLVFVVSTLFLTALIYQRITPRTLQFSKLPQEINSQNSIGKVPTGIAIQSIKVWLPLVPSHINNDKWETTSVGVSYWKEGVTPGSVGNAIMYGHNWPNLLGGLYKVNPGDEIRIYYSDNSITSFKVFFVQEVLPNNTSILLQSDDRRITLYTCSGFLDTKRFVVVGREG